jgi:uncharacterized membrane protein
MFNLFRQALILALSLIFLYYFSIESAELRNYEKYTDAWNTATGKKAIINIGLIKAIILGGKSHEKSDEQDGRYGA